MKAVIKLTNREHEEILIGVNSIIDVVYLPQHGVTQIRSVGAMVTTHYVLQLVEEIYEQINK